jgi:hypothetical protein
LQNTPLHPVAEWGRQRFGGADVPAERRLADLENTLALIGLSPEYAPLIAPLVDIAIPEARAAKFPPEELRRRQLAAMTNWLIAGARTQPLVLALEDVHWADPTTLDLLRGIAERGARAPLFVLITTRPEFRPPWSMRSHHGMIALAPLDHQQVRHMVGELAARHALPKKGTLPIRNVSPIPARPSNNASMITVPTIATLAAEPISALVNDRPLAICHSRATR